MFFKCWTTLKVCVHPRCLQKRLLMLGLEPKQLIVEQQARDALWPFGARIKRFWAKVHKFSSEGYFFADKYVACGVFFSWGLGWWLHGHQEKKPAVSQFEVVVIISYSIRCLCLRSFPRFSCIVYLYLHRKLLKIPLSRMNLSVWINFGKLQMHLGVEVPKIRNCEMNISGKLSESPWWDENPWKGDESEGRWASARLQLLWFSVSFAFRSFSVWLSVTRSAIFYSCRNSNDCARRSKELFPYLIHIRIYIPTYKVK